MPDSTQQIRVLHLEDDDRDAHLIARNLKDNGLVCDITRVSDRIGFEAALPAGAFQIILCDYNIPGYNGVSALKLARQARPDVPVILLSGTLSEEDAVRCLHMGATDYLAKQRLERLVPAVNRALQEAEAQRIRRRSEAALRASEERFRLLADNSNEVFWFVDTNPLRVAYLSPSVERIWGPQVDEFYRDPYMWINAIHPEDSARVRASWVALLIGRTTAFEEEYRVVRTDGSIRSVLSTGTALRNEAGKLVRLGGLIRDTTERKQLEAQLLQAQKMESVGQLASGIAHDFNNLLTVINSTAELAAMELPEADPLRRELAEIRHAGARAAALTRQLLAFSRKQILAPAIVDLNALVMNTETMLRRVIGETIELSLLLAGDLVRVKVDPGQIEQVILNLAINSRDAMPNGGTLTFETRNVVTESPDPGTDGTAEVVHAVLVVSDTGTGMDESTQQKMFEPFFTTKGPGKGTGLGLSTAHGIIRQSGGTISVTSAPGQGTSVRISLPGAEMAEDEPRIIPDSVAAPPRKQGAEAILVVEDDPALQGVVRRILARAGYTVSVASNAADALSLLAREDSAVSLLLTDVVMPGMSGRQLAELVAERHPGIRILFTSGYTDDAIMHLGVLDAGVHFIGKPYSVSSLVTKVREVLDSQQ